MPSGKEPHIGRQIVALMNEFDASVSLAEEFLLARAWPELKAALADQRRLTHAVSNLVAASKGRRPEAFNEELRRRLRTIEEKRADQRRRLVAFRDAVGSRLTMLGRAKAMQRAVRSTDGPPPAIINAFR